MISSAIVINKEYSHYVGIESFFNEIFTSINFIRQLPFFSQLSSTIIYNYFFGFKNEVSMILPSLAQGYMYFGVIGAPILSTFFCFLIYCVEKRLIISSNIGEKYAFYILSGIIYCGHCNEKLTTFLETKRYKKKDGEITTSYAYRYRCMSFYKRGAVKCDGQSAYGAKKINTAVIEETKQFMIELEKKNLNEEFLETKQKQLDQAIILKGQKQVQLSQSYNELKVLKNEVVNSLMGNSSFKPEMLNELISSKEQEIADRNIEIDKSHTQIIDLKNDIEYYVRAKDDIYNWGERFDLATEEEQKSMVINAVDKVTVFRNKIRINGILK
jgi:hypothetical protein